jgi:hypothetical protein
MNAVARLSLTFAIVLVAIGGAGVLLSEGGFATAKTALFVGGGFAVFMLIPFAMALKCKPAARTVALVLSGLFTVAIAGRFAPKVWIPAIKGDAEFGLAGGVGLAMFVACLIFFFLFRKTTPSPVR